MLHLDTIPLRKAAGMLHLTVLMVSESSVLVEYTILSAFETCRISGNTYTLKLWSGRTSIPVRFPSIVSSTLTR